LGELSLYFSERKWFGELSGGGVGVGCRYLSFAAEMGLFFVYRSNAL
jgi:hypothetical protein